MPAEVALWPHLTGREVLELAAHLGPGPDLAYRDELVQRFELDLDKRARTYSTGNRQKVALGGGVRDPGPGADLGRADQRAGPVDGTGVPGLRPGGPRPRSDGVRELSPARRGGSGL